MSTTGERNGARAAYDAFAPYYDLFTREHDYESWLTTLLELARAHGLRDGRLLDVGCGTGKSFLPLLSRGWDVTGCDVSPAMLERAAGKAAGAARLEVADVRTLPRLGAYDLVLCLDDVVNYLADAADLAPALAAMGANLATGGLLLFDANTLLTYRTFFAGVQVVEDEHACLLWRGHAGSDAPPGVLATATLDAFTREAAGSWSREHSVHVQRHHPCDVIRDALARAGLECLSVHGHGLDGRPEPSLDESRHTKAVFIARSGAPEAERR